MTPPAPAHRTRREVPPGPAALLLLAVACGGTETTRTEPPAPAAPGRPSIVLVSLDTTRADRLGCYGREGAATPVLDRLAAGGVVFDHVATPVPVTLPAHASLLTGRDPAAHGVHDNGLHRLPRDLTTMAERLAPAGYDTAAVVGAAVLDRQYGLDQGFARYDDAVAGSGLAIPERDAAAVTDAALRATAALTPPFFLFVHYFDPHADYRPPPPFDRAFRDDPYDGEIAYVDQELGRLLASLEASGSAEDLIVAVTADHGESLGEHGEATHGVLLYQSTLRVPLIIRAPGRLPAGRRVASFARLTDVLPTLVELAGLPPPDGLDGVSLVAAVDGADAAERWLPLESELGYNAYGWAPLRGITDGTLKWIDAPQPELYDLAEDPGERRNLHRERAGDAERLAARSRQATEGARRATAPGGGDAADEAARLAELSALGYVPAPGRPDARDRTLPDPKAVIGSLAAINEARALLGSGRPGDAIELLEPVVAKAPGNVSAQVLLASALLGAGRPGDALPPLRQAAVMAPTNGDVRYNLGLALMGTGDTAAAEEAWRATLRLVPRYHDAAANLIDLLQRSGRPGEADQFLSRARGLGLGSPVLDFLEGRLALQRGDRSGARRALRRALSGELAPAMAAEARAMLTAAGP